MIVITSPISFFHSKSTRSIPNNPNSSIRYAQTNWAVTMNITDLAGPRLPTELTTVYVIKAPIAPPSSKYLGETENIDIRPASLPVTNHAARHTKNAVS